ncbi:hypothetical protein [Paramaledivibacter caminithermalis]|nr:hypothetical protein [Paramaledivibacter caminithermalis]
MMSVLTHDMLDMADINGILNLYKDGYVHIEPNIKKVSIINLGIEKKDIKAISKFNYSINIFSSNFNLKHILSINSDVCILWGGKKEIEDISYLVKKVKQLIGKKNLIGIGVGQKVLEAACKDINEDKWKKVNEGKKHCKYMIYCMDIIDLLEISEII